MPGPPQKAATKRIRTTTKSIGVIRSTAKAPTMPRGLCQQAKDAWTTYWSNTVSGVMRPEDATVALRWISNTDRYLRLIAAADAEPMVVGSTGQPKPNGLYDLAYKIEKSIREDESQLGVGPLSRLRLGAQLTETAKTLADLNAETTNVTDPRATLTAVADDSS